MPSLDVKIILMALLTATLTAGGLFFQKLNGARGGNTLLSGWLALAVVCYFPTFLLANKAFAMGGRMSLFVPVTASTYILTMLAGRFYFREEVSWGPWFGCALIVAGVGAIARG